MEQLLTTEQVAELAQVKPKTIRQWYLVGEIPRNARRRIGRTVRWHARIIRGWLETAGPSTGGNLKMVDRRTHRAASG